MSDQICGALWVLGSGVAPAYALLGGQALVGIGRGTHESVAWAAPVQWTGRAARSVR